MTLQPVYYPVELTHHWTLQTALLQDQEMELKQLEAVMLMPKARVEEDVEHQDQPAPVYHRASAALAPSPAKIPELLLMLV